MSVSMQTPALSTGNHIYLYRLFKESIGCGKQTLLPAFEEVLETANLAAVDLGFKDTRALLETLDDCVTLTVFKGGRVYATLVAQPAWDEALAVEDTGKQKDTGKGGKSWKKKRADKSLKAVRPKRIKRTEAKPAPEPESETRTAAVVESEPAPAPACDAETELKASSAPKSDAEGAPTSIQASATEHEEASSLKSATEPVPKPETKPEHEPKAQNDDVAAETTVIAADDAHVQESDDADPTDEVTAPAISLTVVYDPEHANDGVQTLESTPRRPNAHAHHTESNASHRTEVPVTDSAPEPQAETSNPASEPDSATERIAATAADDHGHGQDRKHSEHAADAPAPAAQTAAPASVIPDGYPTDFATEVFCSGDLLNELSALLPYGADVLGIVGEYYWIARENGSIVAQRNRATFALRYTNQGTRHETNIRIRRNTQGGMGASWIVDSIEPVKE